MGYSGPARSWCRRAPPPAAFAKFPTFQADVKSITWRRRTRSLKAERRARRRGRSSPRWKDQVKAFAGLNHRVGHPRLGRARRRLFAGRAGPIRPLAVYNEIGQLYPGQRLREYRTRPAARR
ncbi:MAG: hypothetical protein WDO13_02720 [Verrucomicrobiota bacterium]